MRLIFRRYLGKPRQAHGGVAGAGDRLKSAADEQLVLGHQDDNRCVLFLYSTLTATSEAWSFPSVRPGTLCNALQCGGERIRLEPATKTTLNFEGLFRQRRSPVICG